MAIKKQLKNHQMCDIAKLNVEVKHKDARIKVLTDSLNRALNELETMSAQYGDNGSKYLIDRIGEVLE